MCDAPACDAFPKPHYGRLLQTLTGATWPAVHFNTAVADGKTSSAIHRFKWTWRNSKWSASIFVTLRRRVTLLQNRLWMTLLFKSPLPSLSWTSRWVWAITRYLYHRHSPVCAVISHKSGCDKTEGRINSMNSSAQIQRLQNPGRMARMLFGLRCFNSPLSRVAEDIYQLSADIFKGPAKQRVSRTLGVAAVYGWIQLFSRRQKQPECFW